MAKWKEALSGKMHGLYVGPYLTLVWVRANGSWSFDISGKIDGCRYATDDEAKQAAEVALYQRIRSDYDAMVKELQSIDAPAVPDTEYGVVRPTFGAEVE